MSSQSKKASNEEKWVAVQKKAFTHWVNRQLAKREEHIDDLAQDLSSGVKLIILVEILTKANVVPKWFKRAVMKAHKIENCVIALRHLKDHGVTGLTISAENLVDARVDELQFLLGFCWQLLRTFQDVGGSGGKSNSFEQALLEWLRQMTAGYKDIDLTNGFKSHSIQDGKAWLALVNEFKGGLIDYSSFKSENREHNCHTAFTIAEEKLNIPSLIEPAELAAGQTSEKNIVLYLSLWHNAWKELNQGLSKEDLMRRIAELEEAIRKITAENEELRNRKNQMNLSVGQLNENINVLSTETRVVETKRDELSTSLHELTDKYAHEKAAFEKQLKALSDQIKLSSAGSEEQQTALKNQIEDAKRERDALVEELRKLREGLQLENEEMVKKNQLLGKRLVDLRKTREGIEDTLCSRQELEGRLVNDLRKRLLQHVYDMHNWKVFLDQNKEYDSEGLHIVMEGVLADLSFKEQVVTLENAIQEETEILKTLLKEHKETAKEAPKSARKAEEAPKKSGRSGKK